MIFLQFPIPVSLHLLQIYNNGGTLYQPPQNEPTGVHSLSTQRVPATQTLCQGMPHSQPFQIPSPKLLMYRIWGAPTIRKVRRDQGCWFSMMNISTCKGLILRDLNHETKLEVKLH